MINTSDLFYFLIKNKVNFSVATQNYTFDPVLKPTGNY